MIETLYIIGGAVVVLIFGGTLIAVYLLLHANAGYRQSQTAPNGMPRRATVSWRRRGAVTEFRSFVGGSGTSERVVLDLSDLQRRNFTSYIRDLERYGNGRAPPPFPGRPDRPRRGDFSLIDGGKQQE